MLRVFLILAAACAVHAKWYTPCQLAYELRDVYHFPTYQIPTWVCIAYYESTYNTAAVGRANTDGSADHGLFQINDRYWCYPGTGCQKSCSAFEDDNIADDVACIKTIFQQTAAISGNGFTAWTTYSKCQSPASFTASCNL